MGSTGHEVRQLQRRLASVWVYFGRIDGRYDEEVRDAVARYQSWLHIVADEEAEGAVVPLGVAEPLGDAVVGVAEG
ncbi:peptidoglycan-binding protein, partial [Streptomyces sp. adm13(2018)]|uniref:peptidoglycan-binding domain-containing protein n=1 Tax=Streptomyces sp. adm13(2018) TaxID=2479007 RepID=UPI0013A34515